MPKPVCSHPECWAQAKKWIWRADHVSQGGYWLCQAHNDAIQNQLEIFDGKNQKEKAVN